MIIKMYRVFQLKRNWWSLNFLFRRILDWLQITAAPWSYSESLLLEFEEDYLSSTHGM